MGAKTTIDRAGLASRVGVVGAVEATMRREWALHEVYKVERFVPTRVHVWRSQQGASPGVAPE